MDRRDEASEEPGAPEGTRGPGQRWEAGAGVMLLRSWVQDGRLVTRVHRSGPDDDAQRTEVLLGSAPVVEAVARWLEEVARSGRDTGRGGA